MAKYYTRITMKRMAGLLDLSIDVRTTQSTLYICYIFVRGWNTYWSSTLMNAALKGWFSLQNKVETSVQLHVI